MDYFFTVEERRSSDSHSIIFEFLDIQKKPWARHCFRCGPNRSARHLYHILDALWDLKVPEGEVVALIVKDTDGYIIESCWITPNPIKRQVTHSVFKHAPGEPIDLEVRRTIQAAL